MAEMTEERLQEIKHDFDTYVCHDCCETIDPLAAELINEVRRMRARIEELQNLYDANLDALSSEVNRIADLESILAERQWQPIETALKGPKLLLFHTGIEGEPPEAEVGYWFDQHWQNDYGDTLTPTHWMPLPAPPAEVGR